MTEPRVSTTTPDDWDEDTAALLAKVSRHNDGKVLNVLSTVARHPDLLKRWMPFGNHILGTNTLPKRARELATLRVGLLAGSVYEWVQHVSIARAVGCTDDEIERVVAGPDASGWAPADQALLQAADELMAGDTVSDATWASLVEHWSEQQRIDLVFTVGQYRMISAALNTFGVQIEDDVTERFPAELFESGRFAAGNGGSGA
jgi:alkylhydroperoxidase family enzyme